MLSRCDDGNGPFIVESLGPEVSTLTVSVEGSEIVTLADVVALSVTFVTVVMLVESVVVGLLLMAEMLSDGVVGAALDGIGLLSLISPLTVVAALAAVGVPELFKAPSPDISFSLFSLSFEVGSGT